MRRFRGTLLAGLALVLLLAVWTVTRTPSPPAAPPAQAVLRFDKQAMVGFRLIRPDWTLAATRTDVGWTVAGEPWRLSRSMVRRITHQLHDLDARATLAEVDDPQRYGLGEGAITVELFLADGQRISFEVGDPNPTSVSHYLRPVPGDDVYVVKRSAVDFWRAEPDAFREAHFAQFDTPDAVELRVDGTALPMTFSRASERTWMQSRPTGRRASRDAVRRMLGRISGLRADRFVADQPASLEPWGLHDPVARVRVGLGGGQLLNIDVGATIPDSEPPLRWVRHVEEDAVYAVRDGLLEPFELPDDAYRDREVLGRNGWDVLHLEAEVDGVPIVLLRTVDSWRWPDGEEVDGSTPKRVAERAAALTATGFSDTAAVADPPWATVALTFEDGVRTLRLGPVLDGEQRVQVDETDETYVVGDGLAGVLDDLAREWQRKLERDDARAGDVDGASPRD